MATRHKQRQGWHDVIGVGRGVVITSGPRPGLSRRTQHWILFWIGVAAFMGAMTVATPAGGLYLNLLHTVIDLLLK